MQKLLSICIPTWNRAGYLESALNKIVPQAVEFRDKVEICVSNNGSTDNTKEVVMKFKEEYPDLIKYTENERNLGFDKNCLKVIDMAGGDFAWTFSDDDSIVDNGLKELINFLENIKDKNVGVVHLNALNYEFDKEKNAMVLDGFYKDETYLGDFEMKSEDAIKRLDSVFMSVLIFNNKLLKKMFQENYALVEKGVGYLCIHAWLYFLMFVLNEGHKRYLLKKPIVICGQGEPPRSKSLIEEEFLVIYYVGIKHFDMLKAITTNRNFINSFNKVQRRAKIDFIWNLALRKAFNIFSYESYFGCIKQFFSYLKFTDALLFSLAFMIISIVPSPILRRLCKIFKTIKHGKRAEYLWNKTIVRASVVQNLPSEYSREAKI